AVPYGRVVETDRGRHAGPEVGGILDVVDAGVGIVAAEQVRRVVARERVPWRRVSRGRFTEGKARELNEEQLRRNVAAARDVKQLGVVAKAGIQAVRVESISSQGAELNVGLTEGADHAVFGRGTRIEGERQA